MADDTAERVTSASKLKTLCVLALNVKNRTSTASGELGQAVAAAVESNHLHAAAFSDIKRLYIALKKDAVKASARLRMFDLYRDLMKLDTMMQDELPLEDGEGEEEGEEAAPRKGRGTKRSLKEATKASDRALEEIKGRVGVGAEGG